MERAQSSNYSDRFLQSQYFITKILAESSSLKESIRDILRVICDKFDWEFGALWKVDEAKAMIACLETWCIPGFENEDFVKTTREKVFPFGDGLPGEIWKMGMPNWFSNIRDDAHFQRKNLAVQAGLSSAIAFPFRVDNRVVGVMEFFSRQTKFYNGDLSDLILITGHQIGQFIERKMAEEKIKQYTDLINLSRDAIVVLDLQGKIEFWNKGAEELYGWPSEEACGKIIHTLLNTGFPESLQRTHAQLFENGRWEGLLIHLNRSRKVVFVDSRWALLRDENGKPVSIMKINRDVTSHKKNEEALEESNQRFQRAASLSVDILYTARPDGGCDYLNPRFFEYTGILPSEPPRIAWKKAIHPEDLKESRKAWKECVKNHTPYERCFRMKSKTGEYRWFLTRTQPILSSEGKTLKWFGSSVETSGAPQ